MRLAVTLSIRNACLSQRMFVTRVDYYDSKGSLKKKYLSPIHREIHKLCIKNPRIPLRGAPTREPAAKPTGILELIQ